MIQQYRLYADYDVDLLLAYARLDFNFGQGLPIDASGSWRRRPSYGHRQTSGIKLEHASSTPDATLAIGQLAGIHLNPTS